MRYLLALVLLLAAGLPAAGLEAGAAKIEITPAIGVPLNGYGDRNGRPSVGVHDPLWARCLYLNDGETQVMLVNTDLCFISPELRRRVLDLAPAEIPRENIVLTATHTHNGPGGMSRSVPRRFVTGRYIPELVESTAQAIVQAMQQAQEKTQRAAIGFGSGAQQGLSINRRNPEGPIDEQIGVLRVDDADGNPIAILANFAAHPTTVPEADRFQMSADYPGFYYQELERLTSEGCVAMFMNGAEGNQACGQPDNVAGWAQAERIGKLLAARVKEIANDIDYSEGKLRVGYATPALPPTLATSFQPEQTVIQVLEVDGLIMHFFPGEPTVEIGLELRQRALRQGYRAQWSVGLANDYLMYFVPRSFYSHFDYETAMHFFGPGMEDWLHSQFQLLMKDGHAPLEDPVELPRIDEAEGVVQIALEGTPYAIGYQRGAAFQAALRSLYEERVVDRVRSGAWLPDTGMWSWTPPFIDASGIALPAIAIAARPLTRGMTDATQSEIEGLAAGCGLPFDAVWLLQNAAAAESVEDKNLLVQTPLCTMFAVKRPDGPLLLGRNLDWSGVEQPTVIECRPTSGRAFTQVGFSWNAGVFTGMNDAGVVVALERARNTAQWQTEGPTPEMALRKVLEYYATLTEALAYLKTLTHLKGCHVLVAGRLDEGGWDAAVVEYGATVSVRQVESGLLPGTLPEVDAGDGDAQARYQRVQHLLSVPEAVDVAYMERVLSDAALDAEPGARIWNSATVHSVVFEPQARRMHVAFPGEDGPGEYRTYRLTAEEAP
ncbi:MAG: neutral/alkaline non-lysosomal ceramidase N-terminal domain-containing protein [Candidatus Hydrogenedentes bacterium]|nr:neutral/alkaline non-lysosomal ceramidase N-terminal domain-containing protein [Candidatus Hydrogenedentota bacterium]